MSNRKWLNTFLTCLFGGIIGLHRIYVGKFKQAAIAIIVTAVGAILCAIAAGVNNTNHDAFIALTAIGGVCFIAMAIWEIVDLIVICMHNYKDFNGNVIMDDIRK